MLPVSWQTNALLVDDAVLGDAEAAYRAHVDCHDVADLDPAFMPAPREEVEAHIRRSLDSQSLPARPFQMQMLRLRGSGEVVGYWHFQEIPGRPSAVGVSILLIRPMFRRQGLGRALIAGALAAFGPDKQQLWARVYLANPRALSFWASLGFTTLTMHQGTYVSFAQTRPSIILALTRPS